jgi:hypothetical protein
MRNRIRRISDLELVALVAEAETGLLNTEGTIEIDVQSGEWTPACSSQRLKEKMEILFNIAEVEAITRSIGHGDKEE